MSAGWPNRISRAALGPRRKNLIPVRDHTTAVAGEGFNLEHWQPAGANPMVPQAGGPIAGNALVAHEEVWYPDGGPVPTFTHEGTGHYRIVYAATYKDLDDNDVVPALTRVRGFVQATIFTSQACTGGVTNGRQVDLFVFDELGDPQNASVWFEAF